MYKKDCFAFKRYSSGYIQCSALTHIQCYGCKFYRTRSDYNKNVAVLKHKKLLKE